MGSGRVVGWGCILWLGAFASACEKSAPAGTFESRRLTLGSSGGWAERVRVVGSAVKVRPRQVNLNGTSDRASLVAARNEFESFQIVVEADGQSPVKGLTVTLAAPLQRQGGGGEIPAEDVTVYRVGYVDIHTPSDLEGATGRWPDPLIPAVDPFVREARNAFPVDVPAGENRVAWVDVLVPPGTKPGLYLGAMRVSADGGAVSVDVPVELEVLAFTLPSTTTLKSAFGLSNGHLCEGLGVWGCDLSLDLQSEVRAKFVRAALDNRITIADPYAARIDTPWGLAAFRKHGLPFLRGTAPTRLPGAQLSTLQVMRLEGSGLLAWKEELKNDEELFKRAFAFVCDEPFFFPDYGFPKSNWEVCRAKAEPWAQAWPEIPKLITAHIQSVEHEGTVDLLDIMVINVELLDGPADSPWFVGNQRPLYDAFLAEAGARPRELWLYAACGSHGCSRNDDPYTTGWAGYEIDAPASETRAMAWMAYRYRLTGTLYFDMVLLFLKAWEDQYEYTGNGEGTLFYPGTPSRIGGTTPIPVESMRMKLVRDGYEDFEYLHHLRMNGHEAEADEVAKGLFPALYDTARTDVEVQAAKRKLARLVDALPKPGLADGAAEEHNDAADLVSGTGVSLAGESVLPASGSTEGEAAAPEHASPGAGCSSAGKGMAAVGALVVVAWLLHRRRRR